MYITYGGIGLWHNMLDYICQSLFEVGPPIGRLLQQLPQYQRQKDGSQE